MKHVMRIIPLIISILCFLPQAIVYAGHENERPAVSEDTRHETPNADIIPDHNALIKSLSEKLSAPDPSERVRAAQELGKMGQSTTSEMLYLIHILSDTILKDRKTSVRSAAFDSLTKLATALKDRQDVKTLGTILQNPDVGLYRTTIELLADIPNTQSAETLVPFLGNSDSRIRDSVKAALKKIGNPSVVPLISQLNNEDVNIRIIAAMLLGEIKDKRAVEPLIGVLNFRAEQQQLDAEKLRIEAVSALGEIGDVRAIQPLIAVFKDSSPRVREHAARALKKMGALAVGPLNKALMDQDMDTEVNAAMILGDIGDPRSVEPLIQSMLVNAGEDRAWSFRLEAAKALGKIKDPRALDPLKLLLQDKVSPVRDMAQWAIGQISGKSIEKKEADGFWKKILD
jgi:HEAT repeat protein